jgi:hypothetical protein
MTRSSDDADIRQTRSEDLHVYLKHSIGQTECDVMTVGDHASDLHTAIGKYVSLAGRIKVICEAELSL